MMTKKVLRLLDKRGLCIAAMTMFLSSFTGCATHDVVSICPQAVLPLGLGYIRERVDSNPVSARWKPELGRGITASVVGCSSDLETLTAKDEDDIISTVRKHLGTGGCGITSPINRAAIKDEINARLGRNIIRDLLFIDCLE